MYLLLNCLVANSLSVESIQVNLLFFKIFSYDSGCVKETNILYWLEWIPETFSNDYGFASHIFSLSNDTT